MMRVRAPVAQLDRAPDFESVGRRFESCRARHQQRSKIQAPSSKSVLLELGIPIQVAVNNPPLKRSPIDPLLFGIHGFRWRAGERAKFGSRVKEFVSVPSFVEIPHRDRRSAIQGAPERHVITAVGAPARFGSKLREYLRRRHRRHLYYAWSIDRLANLAEYIRPCRQRCAWYLNGRTERERGD